MKFRPVVLSLMALSLGFLALMGTEAKAVGLRDGALAACPNSPNCVSTKATDKKHAIEPIKYTTTQEEALRKLTDIIKSLPRAQIVSSTADYLHATFTSKVFRFVDDVEFLLDDANKTINFRSASREGYSDFGVNRERMEDIRRRFQQ